MRTIVFLITLMFVLPVEGSAQAVLSPGDRIRIERVDGTTLTGTLSTRVAETVLVSVGVDGPIVEVPVEGIEALEISLGRQRRFGKYFGLTVAAASVAGATIGFLAYTESSCSFLCFGPNTRAEYTGFGFAIGVVVGLPLGALMGALIKEERWNPLEIPGPTESGLTIRPLIGNGVGFAGSFSVGSF